ncbi:hypothetical protein MPL3356_540039 [Mesorhizobium plurifarium]|uniref:Uncharacterized protein n=1 Tax=Mesorhizobium plurifarium TaxID=69974 RepID=A0A090E6M1_MESPL|nr:hypothetical protein MPL3356_540039 [Mesorhizobium plurifarium]
MADLLEAPADLSGAFCLRGNLKQRMRQRRADQCKVTVNLGAPVTVNADTLRLVTHRVPPKRKTPLTTGDVTAAGGAYGYCVPLVRKEGAQPRGVSPRRRQAASAGPRHGAKQAILLE